MAIRSVDELPRAREGQVNERFLRTLRRVFLVTTDAWTDGESAVLEAVPALYSVHPSDQGAWLKRKRARLHWGEDGAPGVWRVECEYDSQFDIDGDETENPLVAPVAIRGACSPQQRRLDRDMRGQLVANSAGDPFDPAVVVDDARPVLEITKNLAAMPLALVNQYKDAVNLDPFYGAPRGQWKISHIRFHRERRGPWIFWPTSFEFHFRPEGWKLRLVDQGFYDRDGNEILTANRLTRSRPALLDGQGEPLPDDSPNEAILLEFDAYPELPFAPLGLE